MVNDNARDYADWIDIEGGMQTVHGYATQTGMESIQGQTGTCQIKGIISGTQNAYINGGGASYVDSDGCVQMYGSAVKIGVPDYTRQGDSGGPIWWNTDDGDNLVVTVLTGAEPWDGGSWTGCNTSGKSGRPAYGYPFWRVANNTKYTI